MKFHTKHFFKNNGKLWFKVNKVVFIFFYYHVNNFVNLPRDSFVIFRDGILEGCLYSTKLFYLLFSILNSEYILCCLFHVMLVTSNVLYLGIDSVYFRRFLFMSLSIILNVLYINVFKRRNHYYKKTIYDVTKEERDKSWSVKKDLLVLD